MILVTGATGTVGREVTRLLAGRHPLRVMARRPADVRASGPAAEVVRGDYGDVDSLDRALRGIRAAFLVTNRITEPDDIRFADAARAAGVRHVVKLSAAAVTDPGATDAITQWQRANETVVCGSGMDWTLLRPRSFMSNTLSWAPGIRSHGVVRAVHGSSPNACIDPRDIAEVAVRALTEHGHEGRSYALSGPQTITAVQQTAQLAEVLGKPLRFEELQPDQARAHLGSRYPAPVADALLHSAERQRAGAKAEVYSTVGEVTGRPARTFRTWAAEHAAHFTG